MLRRYASERDFVAQYILPQLKKASEIIGLNEVLDYSIEKKINGDVSDLALERSGHPIFVLEAKFKKKFGNIERDIEPRDPEVIKQAVHYAVLGGYPYYTTCNVKRIILFKLQAGVKLFESEIASFEYNQTPNWAEEILNYTLGLKKAEPKPLDDTLVNILLEAYNDLYPEFLQSLKKQLKKEDFFIRFTEWIENQGIQLSDENIGLIASQATYMEINKFVFYHIIRVIYPDELTKLKIEEYEDVSRTLKSCYSQVLKIDYAPIYEKTIISEIPFTLRVEERIRTLLETLNLFDFSKVESDFIGRIYEKLIPPIERKRLGQFYTPPGIVELITDLTLNDKDQIILDPGCGSGTFLVKSYQRFKKLKGIKGDNKDLSIIYSGRKILDQIYGIDINQFPAHLSVINLAIQNPYAKIDKKINVIVEDFFNIKPGVSTLTGFQSLTTDGKEIKIDLPAFFDIIIGNPPYIRQELLGEKEKNKIENLINNEYNKKVSIGSGGKKNSIELNKQSDIFIYFFVHGLKLIRNKGLIGFITSNKWLEVLYGLPFQEFLLKNVKILYIIEFDKAVFPDAEVNTAITIIQKDNVEKQKKENLVKFIRFKKNLSIEQMEEYIQTSKNSYEDDVIKITIIKQDDLKTGKWNIFLRAPPIFGKIIGKSEIQPFFNFVDIVRAPTTGNNDYFIISKEEVAEWNIEKEYIELCISSPKDVDGMVVKKSSEYMIFINKNKNELENTNILKYIEYGEKLEVEVKRGSNKGIKRLNEVETLKNRKPFWYSLPKREAPPILFPRLIDVKPIFLKNSLKVHTPHVFYYIYPKNIENEDILLAILNSSLTALLAEIYGRSYGGGVLELSVNELKNLPIINPNDLLEDEKKYLKNAYFELINSKDSNKVIYQNKLDQLVFNILGLSEKEGNEIVLNLKTLQKIRRLRKDI